MDTLETLNNFKVKATALEQETKQLMLAVRGFLNETDLNTFYEAESDLYDAMDCLQDFLESCEMQIDLLEADAKN